MYTYAEYKGTINKKCPIDYGKRILRLNWNMSSSMLDQYIYKNDNGDLFFVTGVMQHTAGLLNNSFLGTGHKKDLYHLALVTPIKSKDLLIKYLKGKIPFREALNKSGKSYLLKLTAPTYIWSSDNKEHISMQPVKNGKEVTRKVQLQLHEFGTIECKVCPTRTLPYMFNPDNYTGHYSYKKKLSFIFISDEEKLQIDKFVKEVKQKK